MKSTRTSGVPTRRGPIVLIVAIAVALCLLPAVAGAHTGAARTAESRNDQRVTNVHGAKPTIVLVHGAWADASGWTQVINLLRAQGYTVVAPPNPLRGLSHDAAYIANYLKTVSGPIVLVAHSYGGAVITNAATGNPNVKALVYIDAFVPAQGDNLLQLATAKPGSCVGGDPTSTFTFVTDPAQPAGDPDLYLKIPAGSGYMGFDECFANFVDRNDAAVLAAGQRPLAEGSFVEPSGPPAWSTIPSWALIGTHDHVIPPAELQFMATRAGAHIQYVTAGHLSMITQPRATVGLILRAVNATS